MESARAEAAANAAVLAMIAVAASNARVRVD
jgi:hypothetical protein